MRTVPTARNEYPSARYSCLSSTPNTGAESIDSFGCIVPVTEGSREFLSYAINKTKTKNGLV
jgi:hypothetical protein